MATEPKKLMVSRIERALDDGGYVFTKKFIFGCANNDWSTAVECLKQWQAEGKLEILKPLDRAEDNDQIVRMKSYIEGKSRWSDWPPSK
jgi:hypothetical protein